MPGIKDILFGFSEEIRLRIALLLLDSRLCVNCLVDVLGLPQPTVSRHLGILRMTGIVEARKDKLHSYYTFNTKKPYGALNKKLIDAYRCALTEAEPFRTDRERLEKLKEACTADCTLHAGKGRQRA